jgi:hypothetical protein
MNIKYLVTTKEWRDKINGNTYFSSQIENLENGTIKKIPFQYGYGTQSEYVCKNYLGFEGFPLDLPIRFVKIPNCKKKEVKSFGGNY